MTSRLLELNWFLMTNLFATEGKSLSSVIASVRTSTFGLVGSITLEGELPSSGMALPGTPTFGLARRVEALSELLGLHSATKVNGALLERVIIRTHYSYYPSTFCALSTLIHSPGSRKPWRADSKAQVSAM